LGLKLRKRREERDVIAGALELGPTASDPHKTNHLKSFSFLSSSQYHSLQLVSFEQAASSRQAQEQSCACLLDAACLPFPLVFNLETLDSLGSAFFFCFACGTCSACLLES
jgi:hypothetical protein